jgi:high-affinity iron transporter
MAFVFIGKGIRELQEGNVVPITVMPSLPSVPAMGMFPSLETAGAQAILLLLFLFMMVKTFMPRDEVVQAS